eukprot:20980-Heterococcus_DN1.PRE.2
MRACVYLCVTDLPVQVEAATSIKYLLDVTDPAMDAMLLPILPDMLNQYFAIMAEISNDMVIQCSQAYVIQYFGAACTVNCCDVCVDVSLMCSVPSYHSIRINGCTAAVYTFKQQQHCA